jgi:hypothetical protein
MRTREARLRVLRLQPRPLESLKLKIRRTQGGRQPQANESEIAESGNRTDSPFPHRRGVKW